MLAVSSCGCDRSHTHVAALSHRQRIGPKSRKREPKASIRTASAPTLSELQRRFPGWHELNARVVEAFRLLSMLFDVVCPHDIRRIAKKAGKRGFARLGGVPYYCANPAWTRSLPPAANPPRTNV